MRGVLDSRQYVFWRNHSTTDALYEMVSYIPESKRVGQYTSLINLDIKNAFNTAGQTDLLRLLSEYGVTSDLLGPIESFLLHRSVISNKRKHFFNVGMS